MSDVELLKEQAGIAACRFVKDGMLLGLGTGSTVRYSIIEIARLITEEGMNIVGVPTSDDTRRISEELGIPLDAMSFRKLASAYFAQGEYAKALEMYEKSREINLKAFGIHAW